MLTEFCANTELHPNRIDLNWSWQDANPIAPALRLVRRQRAYPGQVDDGFTVLDLAELSPADGLARWQVIEHTRYLTVNSNAEGGLLQAEVIFCYTTEASEPQLAIVRIYDAESTSVPAYQTVLFAVASVTRTEVSGPPWSAVVTLECNAKEPKTKKSIRIAELQIYTGQADGTDPDKLQWISYHNSAGKGLSVAFNHLETQVTVLADLSTDSRAHFKTVLPGAWLTHGEETKQITLNKLPMAEIRYLALQHERPAEARDGLLREFWLDERFDPDSGEWRRQVTLHDMGLQPETDYYYALFAPDGQTGNYRTERTWRTAATTTRDYGLGERLYRLLPSIHQQYDEPAPGHDGAGQLRSFVEIFGAALDQVRSLDEDLASRHDVDQVRADLLPHLAHWIGWELDDTLGTLAQRDEIRMAPTRYETLGTLPNLRDLVYHVTGRECKIKEFAQNVFLTNAPEPIPFWEIWRAMLNEEGKLSAPPMLVTRFDGFAGDGFDGHPATVLDGDDKTWVFWHGNRIGRREIWLKQIEPEQTDGQRAMQDAPEDIPNLSYADESPVAAWAGLRVWLVWSSNRDGNWEIYGRTYAGLDKPGGAAQNLSVHPADDRAPALARGTYSTLWLFWQSNRRGPTDIWVRAEQGETWSLPLRVTTAAHRHETPAAVEYQSQLWLFWSDDQGDGSRIYCKRRATARWTPGEAIGEGWREPAELVSEGQGDHGKRFRDEAPTAVGLRDKFWLFWHSNRTGHWQIWGRIFDDTGWSPPFQVTTDTAGNKEPAAYVDTGDNLWLYWRSQRRGSAFQSRSVDFRDSEMVAQLGAFADRAHYTYDTRTYAVQKDSWESNRYARGAVGVYLSKSLPDVSFQRKWNELEKGLLMQAFEQIFAEADPPLTDPIVDVTAQSNDEWKIRGQSNAYQALKQERTLTVYRLLPRRTKLFEIEFDHFEKVKQAKILPAFQQLFAAAGFPLTGSVSISPNHRVRCWRIADKDKRYVVLKIGDDLIVYDLDAVEPVLQQLNDYIEPFRPAQMQYIWKIGQGSE